MSQSTVSIVGTSTAQCTSVGIDTPHTIELDRVSSIQHKGATLSVCPNHIYHMSVVKPYQSQGFVVLQATPGTTSAEVLSELSAGSITREPVMALLHASNFRRPTRAVEIYTVGIKLRVQITGTVYNQGKRWLVVEEVSSRCYWGKCVRNNGGKKAFLEIEAPTAEQVEVAKAEDGTTMCADSTIAKLLALAKAAAKAVAEKKAAAAKKAAEIESSEDEIDYSNDTKKSKKKGGNKKNNKKGGAGGAKTAGGNGTATNQRDTPSNTNNNTPSTAPKGGKNSNSSKARPVPVLFEAILVKEGMRLEDITTEVPPCTPGPLPRVGDRCFVGVTTAVASGPPQCAILDFPYSSPGAADGGGGAVLQLSDAVQLEVSSDAVTTCLLEGLADYDGDDCSAEGGDDEDEEEEEDNEDDSTSQNMDPLCDLVANLYPLDDSESDEEEEEVEEAATKSHQVSEKLQQFMSKMEKGKKEEKSPTTEEKPVIKLQTKPKEKSSKKLQQKQKDARREFQRTRLAAPKEEQRAPEPEKSAEEKIAEISADYDSLKAPIEAAGDVTKLSEFERKMFFENSMKILYRLDSLEGLGQQPGQSEETAQGLRQQRKDLVKSVQALQDKATVTD